MCIHCETKIQPKQSYTELSTIDPQVNPKLSRKQFMEWNNSYNQFNRNSEKKIPTPLKKNWHFHLPPIFKKLQTPSKTTNFKVYVWGFQAGKNQKIAGAISGPRIAGRKITDMRPFLKKLQRILCNVICT